MKEVADADKVLQNRLYRPEWMTVFKSLIIIHLMIREGEPDVMLRHLSHNPQRKLAFAEGMQFLY